MYSFIPTQTVRTTDENNNDDLIENLNKTKYLSPLTLLKDELPFPKVPSN
jgi:hypothetical protein